MVDENPAPSLSPEDPIPNGNNSLPPIIAPDQPSTVSQSVPVIPAPPEHHRQSHSKLIITIVAIFVLLVILVVGVVGVYTVAAVKSQQQLAKDAKRKSDIEVIRVGLEVCRSDSGQYPTELEGLKKCYGMTTIPSDPDTQKSYIYNPGPTRITYTLKAILSSGATYSVNEPK